MAELYVVMTEPVVGYPQCAQAAAEAGVPFVQLRMKGASTAEVITVARDVKRAITGSRTRFIVNDDLTAAIESDADGIHLGQSDTALVAARARWQAPGKCFGWSTHNEEEQARALALKPDYIGIGPVFPTPTKAIPDPDLGLPRLQRMIQATLPLPHVAIGGITLENLPDVLACGATMFCSVRPIMTSHDPLTTIRAFQHVAAESLN